MKHTKYLMSITPMMEFENIKILNKNYNKLFLTATYNLLKDKDVLTNYQGEDLFSKKKIKINRSKDLLDLWRLFFKELTPLLKSMSNKERVELIHYIFGNSVKSTLSLWHHWPILEEVAV